MLLDTEVPDYRFNRVIKNEEFMYASGLSIAVSHIAEALSAMRKDNWELISVIGDVNDAKKVGFFFKRI